MKIVILHRFVSHYQMVYGQFFGGRTRKIQNPWVDPIMGTSWEPSPKILLKVSELAGKIINFSTRCGILSGMFDGSEGG